MHLKGKQIEFELDGSIISIQFDINPNHFKCNLNKFFLVFANNLKLNSFERKIGFCIQST